jgi:hypothetical protein
LTSQTIDSLSTGQSSTIKIGEVDWHSDRPLAQIGFLEKGDKLETRHVQYNGVSKDGGYHLRFNGADHEVIIKTPREFELSKFMLKPEVKDFSKFILSPMPGTLISCSKFPLFDPIAHKS